MEGYGKVRPTWSGSFDWPVKFQQQADPIYFGQLLHQAGYQSGKDCFSGQRMCSDLKHLAYQSRLNCSLGSDSPANVSLVWNEK